MIAVKLEKTDLSTSPAARVNVNALLQNNGSDEDFLECSILGVPAAWISIANPVTRLPASGSQWIPIAIQVPPIPQAQAGRYPITVRVVSQKDPSRVAQAQLSLVVAAFQAQGRVGVLMDSVQFSVAPGKSVRVPIVLLNQGIEEDLFRLGVDGIPASWVSTTSPITPLQPGESKTVDLLIQPPLDPQSRAGRHSFKILVTSQLAPDQRVQADCVLTVAAFGDFEALLDPDLAEAGAAVKLVVNNQGNVQQDLSVGWQSGSDALLFEILEPPAAPQPGQPQQPVKRLYQPGEAYPIRVPSGESATLLFQARPQKTLWFGAERAFPYQVSLVAPNKKRELNGNIAARGMIPIWILAAVAVVILGLICISSWIVFQNRGDVGSATQTAEYATAQVIGITQTSIANQTQAAAVGPEDTDGDGLTNQEEVQLGTDPNNPDTDQDQLMDGPEVKTLRTNPLNPDSDADQLTDGDEVNRIRTDPLKMDTDGDGLGDGDEVNRTTDPLQFDTDRDALGDGNEVQIGTDPLRPDTDNDLLQDGQEPLPCPHPLNPDTDSDSLIDGRDLNPCDPNNPSLTATAIAGIPPTAIPPLPPSPPTPTLPPPPPQATNTSEPPRRLPGLIAFVSNREGSFQVFAGEDPSGQNVSRLTSPPGDNAQPAWAPNRDRIAFTSNRDGNNEIYLMNANGSELMNLTNHPADDQNPTWSLDEQWIAFTSNRDGNQEIYLVRPDGSDLRNLTNNPANDFQPTFALGPGDFVVFVSDRDGNREIYRLRQDGSDLANLTNNPANDDRPSGSPLQTLLTFTTDRDGNPEIYVMGSDGSSPRNLSQSPTQDFYSCWSPDGLWIAFTTDRNGQLEIYVMEEDGSGAFNFSNNPAQDQAPTWK
jgi:hypothetical protein